MTAVNYEALAAISKKYSGDTLAILLFPCNQFLGQEPGTLPEIKEFIKNTGMLDALVRPLRCSAPRPALRLASLADRLAPVACPHQKPITHVFSKAIVNGKETSDVYRFLRSATLPEPKGGVPGTAQKPGDALGWNFQQYIIDADGQVAMRLAHKDLATVLDTPEYFGKWATVVEGQGPTVEDASVSLSGSVQSGGKGTFDAIATIKVDGGQLTLGSEQYALAGCTVGEPKSVRKGHENALRLDLSAGATGEKKFIVSVGDAEALAQLKAALAINSDAEVLAAAMATPARGDRGAAVAAVDAAIKAAPLVIFSKTTCGYSKKVKELVAGMNLPVAAHIVEIDECDGTALMQDKLKTLTGASTVPRVFVGGAFVGGCDETLAEHASGDFERKLEAAGAYAVENPLLGDAKAETAGGAAGEMAAHMAEHAASLAADNAGLDLAAHLAEHEKKLTSAEEGVPPESA